MRGFSAIVEEALERLLESNAEGDLASALVEAEGAWTADDAADWERDRREAWATWPADPHSTPTS